MTDRRPLSQFLKEMGLVTEYEIQEALKIQKEKGGLIGEILVDMGFVDRKDVIFALGVQTGLDVVDLDETDLSDELLDRVDANIAEAYKIVPVKWDDNVLTLALPDPFNLGILDDLRFMLDCEVECVIADEKQIEAVIEEHYSTKNKDTMESILAGVAAEDNAILVTDRDNIDIEKLKKDVHSKPVVRLLNLILFQAIKDRASDIHLEPFEEEFKVRYRVDGVLYEMMPPPVHLATAITSRVKVMSALDIAERRIPQDGRIELNIAGRPVDLRVSTLPTLFGESVVMRVLDRTNVNLDMEEVGLRPDELESMKRLIDLPHGIILVTGPTGSGKTTTLYSALNYANSPEIKIITTEDPVEYDLDGIIQIPINSEIGVTFASCLRSILRQDPDKILIGEIRDLETAQIAVQASLTGHVVFSTLHTNDAPSAVTRLLDLGAEPFLVAATLEAIVAQRLVRTICPECKTEYIPDEDELLELRLKPEEVKERTFYYGKGCDNCNGTGYYGRTAIFEIMDLSERIRKLIAEESSTTQLREVALAEGMKPLRHSGLLDIYDGITTIEEVVRETIFTA